VTFKNGEVYNAGRITEYYPENPKNGIYFTGVESVEFNNIKVVSPQQRVVDGEQAGASSDLVPSGAVTLRNIEVQNAGASGFNIVGGNHASGLARGTFHLDNLTVDGSEQAGMYVALSESVNYGKLTSINASKAESFQRAFSFERNVRVEGTELHVVDDQATPTGYKINASDPFGAQSGTMGSIYERVSNGELVIQNSSSLNYVLADAAAAPEQGFVPDP
jgi:hypothetical protein